MVKTTVLFPLIDKFFKKITIIHVLNEKKHGALIPTTVVVKSSGRLTKATMTKKNQWRHKNNQ